MIVIVNLFFFFSLSSCHLGNQLPIALFNACICIYVRVSLCVCVRVCVHEMKEYPYINTRIPPEDNKNIGTRSLTNLVPLNPGDFLEIPLCVLLRKWLRL